MQIILITCKGAGLVNPCDCFVLGYLILSLVVWGFFKEAYQENEALTFSRATLSLTKHIEADKTCPNGFQLLQHDTKWKKGHFKYLKLEVYLF